MAITEQVNPSQPHSVHGLCPFVRCKCPNVLPSLLPKYIPNFYSIAVPKMAVTTVIMTPPPLHLMITQPQLMSKLAAMLRDREKRRPPCAMKSSELSNGENRIALRQLLQNRKLRHL